MVVSDVQGLDIKRGSLCHLFYKRPAIVNQLFLHIANKLLIAITLHDIVLSPIFIKKLHGGHT